MNDGKYHSFHILKIATKTSAFLHEFYFNPTNPKCYDKKHWIGNFRIVVNKTMKNNKFIKQTSTVAEYTTDCK